MFRLFILLLLSTASLHVGAQNVTISGKVSDATSGEDLLFTSVFVKGKNLGTTTNEYGFFSLTIDKSALGADEVVLVVNMISYGTKEILVPLDGDQTVNIKLKPKAEALDAVQVVAEHTRQKDELESTEMSTTRLTMKEIRTLPTLAGETDIVKIVQLLPGVSAGLEGTAGMFVRGGDADQNLVLLDEAVVYNIGHLFGFFSVFNPDAIKDMKMIKGAFPANYGGRLSSILDIHMNDGDQNKIHGTGGIGILSSRLTLEGPIMKDKMSFLVSGRRTYIDQMFKLVNLFVPYYFYDINGKLNYKISDKDRLFYSVYYGNDVLRFDGQDVDNASDEPASDTSAADLGLDFGFTLGNLTNTLRWNHVYSPKLFSNVSLISTSFKYNINGQLAGNSILVSSNILDFGAKADFEYYHDSKTKIKYGAAVTEHIFKPNILSTSGDISDFVGSSEGDRLYTTEMALYGSIDKELSPLIKVNGGLRVSGSVVKGKFYTGLEPRVSGRYLLSEQDAIKLSYSRMKQYMHRVSSSTVALPTDLWYPVTATIKPQVSDQVAIGYNHLFESIKTAITIEGYYKWMNNLIEYREGANLILNDNFEEELLQGSGDSWGTELLVKRDEGKLTGWVSYTLSWATRDFEELNGGNTFYAKYDRRHNIAIVANYKLSKRWTVSAVWVYQTGSRFTAQIGQYLMPNPSLTGLDIIPIYTDRNAVQMSPGHRLDLNFTFGPNPKKDRKFKSEWSFGCYNLYNYATPYRVNIVPLGRWFGL